MRNLKKSATDKKIAGVCGGFGEHTPVPTWVWRALFLILAFVWGIGLVSGALLVGISGTLATRSVVNHPPIATLRAG